MRPDFDIKISIACLFKGIQEQSFFPSDTLIYGISRYGSKNLNIRTCEHMILGQLRMGARQAKNAPLPTLNENLVVSGNGKKGPKKVLQLDDIFFVFRLQITD